MLSKFVQLTIQEERMDIYWKLKESFDVLASILHNKDVKVVHQLRAAHALSEVAKTLRIFIMDEEKIDELEKAVKELKQQVEKRQTGSQST